MARTSLTMQGFQVVIAAGCKAWIGPKLDIDATGLHVPFPPPIRSFFRADGWRPPRPKTAQKIAVTMHGRLLRDCWHLCVRQNIELRRPIEAAAHGLAAATPPSLVNFYDYESMSLHVDADDAAQLRMPSAVAAQTQRCSRPQNLLQWLWSTPSVESTLNPTSTRLGGSQTVMVVPKFAVLSISRRPPCNSIIERASGRPSPVPA
jgi:hypothetical protein